MAAGTVGYTDTRGDKDYLSMIASQIKNRVTEASDMANEERQFAEEKAEAGGTSLDEAGIGKGFFFGKALGSRFGGDAIARTRGRFAKTPTAGIDPAGNAASRFRGGFDYNVTNEIATGDTSDIEAALITGLSGVSQGLQSVSQALIKIDDTLGGLERTQMNMARAIMFQGYVNQMLLSQQQQAAGRNSLRKEERSIEGGRLGGGRIGGSSFGGAGGGRGMFNITPGGAGGGGAGGGSGGGVSGFGSSSSSFLTSNVGNIASRAFGKSLSAGKNMNVVGAGLKGASTYRAISSGDIVGMMGSNSLYKKYNIDTAEILAKNPTSIAQAATKLVGLGGKEADEVVNIVKGGTSSVNYMDDVTKAVKDYGELYTLSDSTTKRILEADVLAKQFGKEPDAIAAAFQQALANNKDTGMMRSTLDEFGGTIGVERFIADSDDFKQTYEMVAKKYGDKNADQFMKLGLFGSTDYMNLDDVGRNVLQNNAIADSLIKNYPDMTYESLEKAVLLARVGNMKDAGYGSTKIVKELRKTMGNNVADELLLKHADDLFKNSKVAGIFGKGSAKVGLRRFLKMIPGIGLGLGVIFGIQRAMKGDFLGAGLEIGSGVLGLNPATSGLGLGIDGFLLARDMGAVPMAEGGIPTGSNVLAMLNDRKDKTPEMVTPLNDETFIKFGEGILNANKRNYSEFSRQNASWLTNMGGSGEGDNSLFKINFGGNDKVDLDGISSNVREIAPAINQLSRDLNNNAGSSNIVNNTTNNYGGTGGKPDQGAESSGGNFSSSGLDAFRLQYIGSLS